MLASCLSGLYHGRGLGQLLELTQFPSRLQKAVCLSCSQHLLTSTLLCLLGASWDLWVYAGVLTSPKGPASLELGGLHWLPESLLQDTCRWTFGGCFHPQCINLFMNPLPATSTH